MTELSITPNTLDLEVYAGDSIYLNIILKTASSTYVTIPDGSTSVLWKSQIKQNSGSVVANFSVSPSAAVSASSLLMYLQPTDLSAYSGLEYDLQVSYINSSSSYVETYLKGGITVISDITD
jgi:hypothetical protein